MAACNLIARRSVGGAGYVGMVKRKLGYGVPPGEEDQVDEATKERLDRLADEVRRINQSRRGREEDGVLILTKTEAA